MGAQNLTTVKECKIPKENWRNFDLRQFFLLPLQKQIRNTVCYKKSGGQPNLVHESNTIFNQNT